MIMIMIIEQIMKKIKILIIKKLLKMNQIKTVKIMMKLLMNFILVKSKITVKVIIAKLVAVLTLLIKMNQPIIKKKKMI